MTYMETRLKREPGSLPSMGGAVSRLTFFQEFFQGKGRNLLLQISIVMLISLLFSDKNLGGGKLLQGEMPPCGRKPEDREVGDPTNQQRFHACPFLMS